MNRKLLYSSLIALIAAGVGYSQLSGMLGWGNDQDTMDAGTLGNRTGDGFNIGMRPSRESGSGSNMTEKPDSNITLDNGLKRGATVDLESK